jgi:hypothetical protein
VWLTGQMAVEPGVSFLVKQWQKGFSCPPKSWNLARCSRRRAPFLRVWMGNSSEPLSDSEYNTVIDRIRRKQFLGWLPSAEEIDIVQYQRQSKQNSPELLSKTRPGLKRFLRSARMINRMYETSKRMRLYNDMLRRYP